MGQINTNNYPTVNSLLDADLLIVENATHGTGTTTPKQLRENAIGTGTLQTSAQTVTGAINELKHEIDLGAGVARYDVNTITSGYLGQFSGSANLLLLHLTTDGIADATNGYMMMLSYSRPVARFAYGRLVDADGVAYKQDVYADNTIICKISNSGEGTESDPVQVVILGIINAGFMLTPTAVVSDRDIQDGQGNTLSVLAEALTKTASGNPVLITDCAGGKARSLITEIEPIQDLHGQSAPYVGGAGKNKLILDLATIKANNTAGTWNGNVYSIAGGTAEILTDSANNVTGIKINGTFNSAVQITIDDYTIPLTANSYIFTCGLNNDGNVGADNNSGIFLSNINGNNSWLLSYADITFRTFTISNPTKLVRCGLYIWEGATVNNLIYYPMIRLSSEQTGFAPYSNICPISGRTAVELRRKSKNLFNGEYDYHSTTRYTPVNANTQYTISSKSTGDRHINLHYLYSDNTFGSNVLVVNIGEISGSVTVTTPSNVKGIEIFVNGDATNTGNYAYDTQIELGDTVTTYEPYEGVPATIQLGQTVYGGSLNLTTGVMTVTWVKYTLSSTGQTWIVSLSEQTIYANFPDLSAVETDRNQIKCSHFMTDLTHQATGTDTNYAIYLSASKNLRVNYRPDGGSVDKDTITNFFDAQITAGTPVEICGILATPTTIQLTPTQLEMLKGYNRLTIDGGSIELGYIAKLT